MTDRDVIAGVRRLVAVAVVGCLAACGEGGAPESWPQPVGGKLTPDMCELLVEEDFEAVGTRFGGWSAREADPGAGPDAIVCQGKGGQRLRLNVQPDPVSAELYFPVLLPRQGTTGAPKVDIVPGADQSWYDTLHGVSHEMLVRRGSLLVGLTLGEADGPEAPAGLATRILERMPQVGATTTGKPHEMVITVTGTNLVTANVEYTDPTRPGERQKEKDVDLPWTKTVRFPWFGDQAQMIGQVLVTRGTAPEPRRRSQVSCRITVDGVEVAAVRAGGWVADCEATYRDGG